MAHVFISYSREDIDFARHLRTLLQAERFDVWLDERDIAPGEYWSDEIRKAVDRSLAFVVVMSPRSETSEWVRRELERAEQKRKPIFPVLLEGTPWGRLENLQYSDMTAGLRAELPALLLNRLKQLRLRQRLIVATVVAVLVIFAASIIRLGLSAWDNEGKTTPTQEASAMLWSATDVPTWAASVPTDTLTATLPNTATATSHTLTSTQTPTLTMSPTFTATYTSSPTYTSTFTSTPTRTPSPTPRILAPEENPYLEFLEGNDAVFMRQSAAIEPVSERASLHDGDVVASQNSTLRAVFHARAYAIISPVTIVRFESIRNTEHELMLAIESGEVFLERGDWPTSVTLSLGKYGYAYMVRAEGSSFRVRYDPESDELRVACFTGMCHIFDVDNELVLPVPARKEYVFDAVDSARMRVYSIPDTDYDSYNQLCGSDCLIIAPTPAYVYGDTPVPPTTPFYVALPVWLPVNATPPTEPFGISISLADVGQFKPAPDGPYGGAGCRATVAITVAGVNSVSGVLCVWNALYSGDGDCGYPVIAWRGTTMYQVMFGGDEGYRAHQVRFRTDSYGTFGPLGGQCSD